MILQVPNETMVSDLNKRLELGGLGTILRKGNYVLVVRAAYPQEYPHFVDPFTPTPVETPTASEELL